MAWSEKAIAGGVAAWLESDPSMTNEYVIARILDAAAAVDGDHVDVRTVTAYESGFAAGKDEAGDVLWNAAIDEAALILRNLQGHVKEDFDEGYNVACVDAESAIRSLKRLK